MGGEEAAVASARSGSPMRRGGVWALVLVALLGMALAAVLGLRWALFLSPAKVLFVTPLNPNSPIGDGVQSGFFFALHERASRAGRFQIEPILSESYSYLMLPKGGTYLSDLPRDLPDLLAMVGPDTPYIDKTRNSIPIVWCSPDRSEAEEPQGRYCVIPAFEAQGRSAAGWAARSGARPVAILSEKWSERGGAVARAFMKRAAELGLEVTKERTLEDQEASLQEIRAENPGLVFFSGEDPPYSKAWEVFSALERAGYAGKFLVADASAYVSLLERPGRLRDGWFLVSPLAPPPPRFVGAYRDFAGKRPGPHVYYGYVAGQAVLEAIARANSLDRQAVRAALASSSCFKKSGESSGPCALYVSRSGAFEFVELLSER